MTRIWLGALFAATIIGGVFYAGAEWAKRDNTETRLEREKDIGDAIHSCADLGWFERLRCDQ